MEGARFEDRLGTLPVEVSLAHNGVSTLDTGILGRVYWDRTGAAGFGAHIRATGPPEAGGSLASYVSPRFIQANAAFVSDPGAVAQAYGDELRDQVLQRFWLFELAAWIIGGLVLTAIFRGRAPFESISSTGRRVTVSALVVVAGLGASALVTVLLFRMWEGEDDIPRSYAMEGIDGLSFDNPRGARDRRAGAAVHREEHRADPRARRRVRGGGGRVAPRRSCRFTPMR